MLAKERESIKETAREKAVIMLLSWLLPGYGFYRHGKKARGIFFFLVLETTFLIGAALRGSVLIPDFNYRSEGFNLVTILTFFTQMFNGLLGLVSVLPELFHGKIAILPYEETNQWADLGSFYLLVSGGMSYFVLMSTYDHFYGRKAGKMAADEAAPEEADHE